MGMLSVVPDQAVQGTRTSYEVTVAEVGALRAYVEEQAGPDEAEAAERLLGQLAARAVDALRSEGEVRMGHRRWRLQRTTASRASKRRFAPGRSPGDDAS